MDSGSLPVVRIADDGELRDVRKLLDQLGVDWLRPDEEPERGTALLIATPQHALCKRFQNGGSSPAAFRIVVADKVTRGAQRELERSRPDFLVNRPFHAAALRLLILHALYVGPERRGSTRIALSAAIRFRTSVFSRSATLVELSRGGCRLVAEHVPQTGEALSVIVPRELTGGAPLSLTGRVVGNDPAGGFEPGEQACSIAFESMDNEKRRALRRLLTRQAATGAHLPLRPEAQVPAAVPTAKPTAQRSATRKAAAARAGCGERRRSPRRAYARPVLASSGGGARVLIGRDISSGGMRVAPGGDLIVGDELKLVVYGPAGSAPLLLRSTVLRDDGSDGCVLRFQNLTPEMVAELDSWTSRLPSLAPAPSGEGGSTHSVVSEVVEDAEESE
jgi:hypothetical protein